jgi:nucleotidyltransferase substrate binding protein (TIGR01987 family)
LDKDALLGFLDRAVDQLEAALSAPAESDLIRAGCIQYFEFCFELAWKSIKQVAGEAGQLDCLSPKAALKQAYANHWLDDQELWLDMLSSRNLMAHTYSSADALGIYQRLPAYLPALRALAGALRKA